VTPLPRPVGIVGPTATGKSELAVRLALALVGGEVVNADAMQLYRGMDIGTAKLAVAQRRGVPHHLLDVLDVTETASVAAYQRQARAAVDDVLRRGGTPILAGGSGLYVAAVVDHLEFPGTDPAVRSGLEAELARVGPAELHRRLAAADPRAAAVILPSNGRRIVRALEVVALTGRPFSAFLPERGAPWRDAVLVGLDRPSDQLDERIERRVRDMFAAGLVDEVRDLLTRGLATGRTASTALGYRQVIAALNGETTLERAAVDTAAATRRFVRRQRSWFRRDTRIRWLDAARPDLLDAVLATVRATPRGTVPAPHPTASP
jgi:tRNA dimethylallyltransferase